MTLSGSTATVDGAGVTVDGDTVTVTAGGTYVLTGSLDGQVVVDSASDDEVKLVLSGAAITSGTGPALTFADAGEAVVVLADGTSNSLTDAATYSDTSDEAPSAALYSTADLTIGGEGALSVTGNNLDGIAGTDGLVISGGTIDVTAVDDGIRGKDHLAITGGTVTVEAGGDALKSTNDTEADSGFIDISGGTLALAAGTDGFDAATDLIVSGGAITVDAADDGLHAELSLVIGDGEITVTRSYEGLEAQYIAVTGGTVDVTAEDDGLNVSAAATATSTDAAADPRQMGGGPGGGMDAIDGLALVTGGTLTIDAGGDGFDSNGNAEITGGTVIVNGPLNDGNGALDVNGTFTVSGGTLIAVGSSGMADTPDADSAQGWVQATVSGSAGSTIQIGNGSSVLAEFTAAKAFSNVVYSGEAVSSGQEYTVTVDGRATTATAGTATAGGMGGMGGGGGRPNR
ncbi:MAG TPA: carbohydrate-binding domain-containing protein [Tessaracoccus flavescens]|uniref:Carbohydrate-binding domain-containing protein n=1 Tax=Tessaracoccus flavescens TaxID=399497 RepID=A0A921JQI1_9ACTN|nr:carbohydrate-binding domain-containing protein [Tessaracoccus flavescens]